MRSKGCDTMVCRIEEFAANMKPTRNGWKIHVEENHVEDPRFGIAVIISVAKALDAARKTRASPMDTVQRLMGMVRTMIDVGTNEGYYSVINVGMDSRLGDVILKNGA